MRHCGPQCTLCAMQKNHVRAIA